LGLRVVVFERDVICKNFSYPHAHVVPPTLKAMHYGVQLISISSPPDSVRKPIFIEGERIIHKEKDVKQQTKDIIEVDKTILHSSLYMKKDKCGWTYTIGT
jgi:hypothetical protein